jgi:hypothetical protein
MDEARFRAGSGRFFKFGSDTGSIGRIIAAVMGPQGLTAPPGCGHQQLRGQQQVPVLIQAGVSAGGNRNSFRTNNGGPP